MGLEDIEKKVADHYNVLNRSFPVSAMIRN
jgi:hypothetical protein